MRTIAFTGQDGYVGFIVAVSDRIPLEQIALLDVPYNSIGLKCDYSIVDNESIPDKYFWKACKLVDGELSVDIESAKKVHLDTLRGLREEKFKQLDIESIKALESGDAVKLASISSKKQALRDVTKIPLPSTLEEIKATLPAILA